MVRHGLDTSRWLSLARLGPLALLVAGLLSLTGGRPAAAQEADRPTTCDAWHLTGTWFGSTTRTGRNQSYQATSLHLLQRGHLLVGRWTPLEGREVTVSGTFVDGIARLTFWKEDTPRYLVLAVASDGTRLGGRWTEAGTGGGEFWARGEATCPPPPQPPPPVAAGPADAPCRAWNLTGRWQVRWPDGSSATSTALARAGWLLRLWQDEADIQGWYEPPGRATRWPVEGTLRGRRFNLTLRLEESLWIERSFVLDPNGRAARATWPIGLGAVGHELLVGRATCTALAQPG